MQTLQDICSLAENAKTRDIYPLFSDEKSSDETSNDENRASCFSVSGAGLYLDYSKQNIVSQELSALCDWASASMLESHIERMFSGEIINNTENRAVLHTVLRASESEKKQVLGDQAKEVLATEQKMRQIVDAVSSGKLASVSNKKFTDVIAIGIGGSYYGIKVGLSALTQHHTTGLNVHVLANVDGQAVEEKLQKLSPDTTLVVVISKTFTTQETLLNAQAVKQWMLANCGLEAIAKHWFAVSTNVKAATEFGLQSEHILPMWDWVGGRFSVWSAVGLPLALALGNENFERFKHGARAMDEHFRYSKFDENMPVLMALLGIWNRNALGYPNLAILPYDHALRALPGYLQQTDMESNGKSVSNNGEKLSWLTAPVVFGQEGTNGQHAFMQLMHQSDDIIPTDFIVACQSASKLKSHHKTLVANCFAQSEALMQGKTMAQAKQELADKGLSEQEIAELAPHKTMKGNTPSNTLLLQSLSPHAFGALLALYEHKIFVQGILWQLNSFDQWGVELGKVLGSQILKVMDGEANQSLSNSSHKLIEKFNNCSN